jgi:hypothetical protein
MGLFDRIFGGGDSKNTRDEKSVQSDINKALKDSGGKWTSNLNDLVAERDRARSGATTSSSGRNALSQGLGSFGRAVSSIPGNIARDVKMGTSAGLFSGRDKQAETLKSKGFSQADIKDYFARTDATRARQEAESAARQNDGPSAQERAQAAAQQMQQTQQQAPMQQSPMYRNPFGQTGTTVMPQPGRPGGVSPDMQREALRIFESQRGAGQVPYQMMPFQQGLGSIRRPDFRIPRFPGTVQPAVMPRMPMPQPPMQGNPNVSPAFQYAAQNYQRLGGSQRLMDRPMEMMSVAERQRINDMAQGMADRQRPTSFPGKGVQNFSPDGMRQSDTLGRLLPLISQMGLGDFRGSGMPPR